jgi:hypothetical protein
MKQVRADDSIIEYLKFVESGLSELINRYTIKYFGKDKIKFVESGLSELNKSYTIKYFGKDKTGRDVYEAVSESAREQIIDEASLLEQSLVNTRNNDEAGMIIKELEYLKAQQFYTDFRFYLIRDDANIKPDNDSLKSAERVESVIHGRSYTLGLSDNLERRIDFITVKEQERTSKSHTVKRIDALRSEILTSR